jgi:chromosome segregation ATPase
MKRNTRTAAAQARAARLSERREREEAHLAAAAAALATIEQTIGSLELAADMANEKLREASDELAVALKVLAEVGYRVADVAQVLGVAPAALRPAAVELRRYLLRPWPRQDGVTEPMPIAEPEDVS